MPTPLKVEKYLKRHSSETVDMDVDPITKKPRISEQSKEIVDIDDGDEWLINKGKTTIVEEDPQDQSQLVSNTERTITNPTIVESTQDPTMVFQKFTLDEVETSLVCSQEELVKDFTNERNQSTNDNYKLMQEIRKIVPRKGPLLAVREADNNVFRIATNEKEGVS